MKQRRRRASRLARRISLVAALIAAILLALRAPPGDMRVWVGIGTLATFLLTRVIALRVAMEYLPD